MIDREEVLNMAMDSKIALVFHPDGETEAYGDADTLQAFARLIESRVVERCAEVCENLEGGYVASTVWTGYHAAAAKNCAAAIRALNNEGEKG
jgi:hypothetical protein